MEAIQGAMRTFLLGLFLIVPLWLARTAMAQANSGELRLRVTDSAGLGLKASVIVVSEGNGYREQLATDEQGNLDLEFLTYGIYQVQIEKRGFASASATVAVRSALPIERTIQMGIAPVTTVIKVSDAETLIDPNRPSSIMQIGTQQIEDRVDRKSVV